MKTARIFILLALTWSVVTPAVAFDRVLPTPRIKDNGDVRLSDDLKIGRFQSGKYVATPDAITTQAPGTVLSISPTGNPTAGALLPTFSGLNIQGTTTQSGNREFMGSFGLTSNKGADQDDTKGNGDKVPLYSGMVQQPGSGNAWSLNTLITRQPGVTKSSIGYEIDVNNNDQHLGEALGEAGLQRPFGFGLIVTGAAPYRSTAAIEVGGPGVSFLWNRGIVISQNSVKQASFQDLTVSDISLDIRGGHQYPIDMANSGIVRGAIRLPKAGHIVAGKPDNAGARDDTGNVQIIGTDASGNIQIGNDGSTLVITGSSILPKAGAQDLGSSASRFRVGYFGNLVVTPATPASSSSPCAQGAITSDANYIYACVAENTWKRVTLASW